jgi:hypothetical protein
VLFGAGLDEGGGVPEGQDLDFAKGTHLCGLSDPKTRDLTGGEYCRGKSVRPINLTIFRWLSTSVFTSQLP